MPRYPIHIVILSLVIVLAGCQRGYDLDGPDDDSVSSETGFIGEAGGAYWRLDLDDDDTFELEKRTSYSAGESEFTLYGDYEYLDSGFIELTIDSGNPDSISLDDPIVVLEGADQAVFIYPFDGGSDDIIALVPSGGCPSEQIDTNFVATQFSSSENASATNNSFFGTLDYLSNNDEDTAYNLNNIRSLDDLFTDVDSDLVILSDYCRYGVVEADGERIYVSTNESILVMPSTSSPSAYLGLKVANDGVDAASLVGNYRGFISLPNDDDEDNALIYAECATSGEDDTSIACSINNLDNHYEDFSANTLYQLSADDSDMNDPALGLFKANLQLSSGDSSGNVGCQFTTIEESAVDTKILVCVAQDPAYTVGVPLTMYLVEETDTSTE